MRVNDFDLLSNLSCLIQDARHPDAAMFRVSSIAPADLSAYLAEAGVTTWGAFWRSDHTVIRCKRDQAGYVVALLNSAGLAYTTSYQPAPSATPQRHTAQRRRAQGRRGGVLATLKGLW